MHVYDHMRVQTDDCSMCVRILVGSVFAGAYMFNLFFFDCDLEKTALEMKPCILPSSSPTHTWVMSWLMVYVHASVCGANGRHPLETKYESLHCAIEPLDKTGLSVHDATLHACSQCICV